MKRFACALLAALLVACLLPTPSMAAETHASLGGLPKVGKVTVTGSAFAADGGGYKTTLSTAAAYDTRGIKTGLNVSATELYTASTLSSATKLTTAPKAGTTYYFAIRVRLGDKNNGKIYGYNTSAILSSSSVTIDGYEVKLETLKEGDGGGYIKLICSATKKQSEKLTGITVTGDGYEYDSELGVYFPKNLEFTFNTDSGTAALQRSYSRFYIDGALTQALKTKPVSGQIYFFVVTVEYEPGAYENAITTENSSVNITGFTDGKVIATKVDPDWGVHVYCVVTATEITNVAITGIDVPVAGKTPDRVAVAGSYNYKIKSVGWSHLATGGTNAGKWLSMVNSATFAKGETYRCTVQVEPVGDFTFPEKKTDITSVTVNSMKAGLSDNYSRKLIYVQMEFTALAEGQEATVYSVFFDAGGGSGTMDSVSAYAGKYTLPDCTFTAPAGKRFKAWSVNGAEKAVGSTVMVSAAVYVTALWEDLPGHHTCTLEGVAKVEPTCVAEGKEAYYKCYGCGKAYEDEQATKVISDVTAWGILPKTEHTPSDWALDNKNHWKRCTVTGCGVTIEGSREAHTDGDGDGKCDACGHKMSNTVQNAGSMGTGDPGKPTEPTANIGEGNSEGSIDPVTTAPTEDGGSGESSNGLWWLWLLIPVPVAGGILVLVLVLVLILVKKKKQS